MSVHSPSGPTTPANHHLIYLKYLILSLLLPATAAGNQRPNILFIAIDDLRPELGCYGAPQVRTPNVADNPTYAETPATMKKLLKKRQAEAAKKSDS